MPVAQAEALKEETPMHVDAEQLAGYCGGFCGTCGISDFQIGTGLAAVKAVVRTAGFRKEAEGLGWPLMRDLATRCCAHFEGEVESFAGMAQKVFPTNCRGGCVPCEIARCCKERGYTTCAECGESETCPKLGEVAKKHPAIRANLQAIASEGVGPWSQAQLRAARAARKLQLAEAVRDAVG